MMAKDSRIGETLWREWSGDQDSSGSSSIFFFTETHIALDHDVVARALASALQRDGIVDSLGLGYRAVESGTVSHLYAGTLDEDDELTLCSKDGETFYGDFVNDILEITMVEIYVETN
jgi:hypothetical protein